LSFTAEVTERTGSVLSVAFSALCGFLSLTAELAEGYAEETEGTNVLRALCGFICVLCGFLSLTAELAEGYAEETERTNVLRALCGFLCALCGFLSLTAELAEVYAEVTERTKDPVFSVVTLFAEDRSKGNKTLTASPAP